MLVRMAINQQVGKALARQYSIQNSKISTVTLFPGHGIGPEITESVTKILDAAGTNIQWERFIIPSAPDGKGNLVSDEMIQSVLTNGTALKGPLGTPIGKGFRSVNLALRKALDLYANVRPVITIPIATSMDKNDHTQDHLKRFEGVDLVTIRENTEGLYSGIEFEPVPGVTQCVKVVTRPACLRIVKYAFEYARANGRKRVSAVHKANIMKLTDGLFLDCAREVRKNYPEIEYDEVIVDAVCMKLVTNPKAWDILVTLNLYGDILSDLCAGLVGGLGLTPSGNYGEKANLFEAVHGTAPDIAGKDIANPTAFLLSSVMMLHTMGKKEESQRIHKAVMTVLKEGRVLTGDLGGKATNSQFTKEVISKLE